MVPFCPRSTAKAPKTAKIRSVRQLFRSALDGNGADRWNVTFRHNQPKDALMPTADKPDAVALLKADHRKVEDLFEKFEAARGGERKKALAQQICTELSVHTVIEEEIFYPACTGEIEDGNLVEEAYVEHDGAKVMIAELLASDPENEFYDAKMKVLSEEIKHHVKEEERRSDGLFAEARAAGLDMDALGERLMTRKTELLAEFKAGGLPAPTTRAFTGHKLRQGKPVAEAKPAA
jgi:Hemerythrin HHE cation binding domain